MPSFTTLRSRNARIVLRNVNSLELIIQYTPSLCASIHQERARAELDDETARAGALPAVVIGAAASRVLVAFDSGRLTLLPCTPSLRRNEAAVGRVTDEEEADTTRREVSAGVLFPFKLDTARDLRCSSSSCFSRVDIRRRDGAAAASTTAGFDNLGCAMAASSASGLGLLELLGDASFESELPVLTRLDVRRPVLLDSFTSSSRSALRFRPSTRPEVFSSSTAAGADDPSVVPPPDRRDDRRGAARGLLFDGSVHLLPPKMAPSSGLLLRLSPKLRAPLASSVPFCPSPSEVASSLAASVAEMVSEAGAISATSATTERLPSSERRLASRA